MTNDPPRRERAPARPLGHAMQLLLLGLAGCAWLPEDHLGRELVQDLGTRLERVGSRGAAAIDGVGDGLGELGRELARVPAGLRGQFGELATGAGDLTRAAEAEFTVRSAAARDTLTSALHATPERLAGLRSNVTRALGLAPSLASLRDSVQGAPRLLGAGRRPMAEPGDPERQTSLERPPRLRSWLERILRRMGRLL